MRGCQVGPETTVDEVKEILSYGANLIRYEIASAVYGSLDEWRSEVNRHTGRLAGLAGSVAEMNFIANLHRVYGEVMSSGYEQNFLWAWGFLHTYTKDFGNVKFEGYLNEPPMGKEKCRYLMNEAFNWTSDKPRKLPVVTYPYSDPIHFRRAEPYGIPKAVYEVHMYLPLAFSHQGLYGYPTGVLYPGMIEVQPGRTEYVDKEWLKKALKPVRSFQLEHRRKILVGEFSCSNFTDASSRIRYLTDLINIFEEYQWSWIYHALFEADVWKPSPAVLSLLIGYWSRNS